MGSNYPASKLITRVMKSYCGVNTRSNGVALVCLQRQVHGGVSFLPVPAHQQWWLLWWCPEPTDREEPLTWKTQSNTAPVSIQFAPVSLEPGQGMLPAGEIVLHGFAQSTTPTLSVEVFLLQVLPFHRTIQVFPSNESINACSSFCIMLPFQSEANDWQDGTRVFISRNKSRGSASLLFHLCFYRDWFSLQWAHFQRGFQSSVLCPLCKSCLVTGSSQMSLIPVVLSPHLTWSQKQRFLGWWSSAVTAPCCVSPQCQCGLSI